VTSRTGVRHALAVHGRALPAVRPPGRRAAQARVRRWLRRARPHRGVCVGSRSRVQGTCSPAARCCTCGIPRTVWRGGRRWVQSAAL